MRNLKYLILIIFVISQAMTQDFEGYYKSEGYEILYIQKLKKKKYEVTEILPWEEKTYTAKLKKNKLVYKKISFWKSGGALVHDRGPKFPISWPILLAREVVYQKVSKASFDLALEEINFYKNHEKYKKEVEDYLRGDGSKGHLLGMMNPKLLKLTNKLHDDLAFNVYGAPFEKSYSKWWLPGNEMKFFKGSVFGKETRVSLYYRTVMGAYEIFKFPSDASAGRYRISHPPMEIIFEDIPSKTAGTSYSKMSDWAPPEIMESQFKGMEYWKPVFYYEKERYILFAEQKYVGSDVGNSLISKLILFDLMNGKTKHSVFTKPNNKRWISQIILSTQLPEGKILIIRTPDSKNQTQVEIYDVLNDKILQKINVSFKGIDFSTKHSKDEKLWMYGLKSENSFYFTTIDENFADMKILKKNTDNSFIFNNYLGKIERLDKGYGSMDRMEMERNKKRLALRSKLLPIKIYDDLLMALDKYDNILIFNLAKEGILERKFGVVQWKNDMLNEQDKEYLNNFDPNLLDDLLTLESKKNEE